MPVPATLIPLPDAPPLPPPPVARRLARGSIPPLDVIGVELEAAVRVRVIEPPEAWSRIVPLSARTGRPLLRRDQPARAAPVGPDRAAAAVLGALVVALGTLGLLLAL
jgi:hypothetical protein